MNEPWLRIKIQPWTDGARRGRVLVAHDRLGARRILRRLEPNEAPAEAGLPGRSGEETRSEPGPPPR